MFVALVALVGHDGSIANSFTGHNTTAIVILNSMSVQIAVGVSGDDDGIAFTNLVKLEYGASVVVEFKHRGSFRRGSL